MSRSHKSSKSPGYDYWSRRPCSGLKPGAQTKRMTHKLERLEAKEIIKEIVSDLEQEPDYHDEIEDSLYCHYYGPCRKCRENNG